MAGTAKWFIPTLFPSTLFHGLSLLCNLVNFTKKEREGEEGEEEEERKVGSRQSTQGITLILTVSVLANESVVEGWPPISSPPCIHIFLHGDFAAIPMRRWGLFFQLLKLNWTCDLLWPIEWGKVQLGWFWPGLKRPNPFCLLLDTMLASQPEDAQVNVWDDDRHVSGCPTHSGRSTLLTHEKNPETKELPCWASPNSNVWKWLPVKPQSVYIALTHRHSPSF